MEEGLYTVSPSNCEMGGGGGAFEDSGGERRWFAATSKGLETRQRLYERYWELLFQRARDQGLDLFAGNRPTRQPWMLKPWRHSSGVYYRIHQAAGRVRVALVVKSRAPLYGEQVYAALEAQRDAIDAALSDGELLWEETETGGRIEASVRGGYAAETDRSVKVTVELLQRMQTVYDPLLSALPLNLLSQTADGPQTSLF